jgi:hypothetical protein
VICHTLALTADRAFEKANVNQVRGSRASGHVTSQEIDAHLQAVEAGRLDVTTAPLISAWGRRPCDATRDYGVRPLVTS